MYPNNLKYSKTHEWVKLENETAKTGITSYAVEKLTDLTYLQFDVEVGDRVSKGKNFGVIESVKATSDLYAQVSGEVTAINTGLVDAVEKIAHAPYEHWLIEIKVGDPSELDSLLSSEAYEEHLKHEQH